MFAIYLYVDQDRGLHSVLAQSKGAWNSSTDLYNFCGKENWSNIAGK